jgi:Reverse transcriptase (RNA-dependent DNA polymerase)
VPGIDFLNNYSSVVNDTSFRILLLLIKKNNLKAWSLNVETSFLNGELEEEIFMKIPEGLNSQEGNEINSNSVLRLKNSIYGLVQIARQWFLKFEEALKVIGFKNNQIDCCFFLKKENSKLCAVCVYVDDCILTVIEGLEKVFTIKVKKKHRRIFGL